MRPAHLVYLHGFRSSPQSTKARRLSAWMAAQRPDIGWHAPQLPASPREAAALVDALIRGLLPAAAPQTAPQTAPQAAPQSTPPVAPPAPGVVLVGSSLGGFYATVMAQRHGLRAVVINPAVQPARDLAAHIGEQTQWHDPSASFFFRPEYVQELAALTPATLEHPGHILALIAQGDEVLDWREMQARYQAGPVKLIPGSDHALSDFDDHLADLLSFLKLTP